MNQPVNIEDSASKEPPAQTEMPFAVVQGEPLALLPEDLYIPPDALEVFMEAFEGPLDLLLYLIKRQNLDVLDIPIANITKQYMQYIEMMETMRFELAAEYLLMAAMLAEIKSRMLLPRPESEDDEDDPRAELVRRLQEYERFKQAAENLNEIPRQERDSWVAKAEAPPLELTRPEPEVDLRELLTAFKDILNRVDVSSSHMIQRETLSIREKMTAVLASVTTDGFTDFTSLFDYAEGRKGIVVTFMAILELLKGAMIDLVQSEPFAPIYVKAASDSELPPDLDIQE
ncbi:MAG: segregation/condensation protein A [endosymbiont of Galathealinum brachiosum]|uniref:Segregation and condensation protein A n=1 Tax=endosymbiont of Galathealinum brachiosum TaxID=2200906 RepID=A0A370DHZ4_9GAMM|nr:MAG: segregation/condensation protein A [endosymbiont of Galathealinum brachiosum]